MFSIFHRVSGLGRLQKVTKDISVPSRKVCILARDRVKYACQIGESENSVVLSLHTEDDSGKQKKCPFTFQRRNFAFLEVAN